MNDKRAKRLPPEALLSSLVAFGEAGFRRLASKKTPGKTRKPRT